MTLKTDYSIDSDMNAVFDLGLAHIDSSGPTASYTSISAALAAAAARGETTFTVNITHNAINASLELQGRYFDSYSAGLLSALAVEDIYNYEVTVELNTDIAGTASIDLNFNFKAT